MTVRGTVRMRVYITLPRNPTSGNRGNLAGIPGSPAAFYHLLMDAASRVTIKSVKELGLQETGLPASGNHAQAC